jgi:hypothetical protein
MAASTVPLSGHNTLVSVQFTPGGAFTEIAELGDITLPGFSRNEFDVTTQNRNIDKYLLGVLRRDSVMWPMNFIPDDPTHGVLGLMKLMKDNTFTGFKITIPTSTGSSVWIGSGQVRTMNNLKAPVDGKMTADVNVRLSDIMSIDGVVFGL